MDPHSPLKYRQRTKKNSLTDYELSLLFPSPLLSSPLQIYLLRHRRRALRMSFLPSRNQSLPVSQPDPPTDQQSQGLRRRLSSLSLQIQPSASPAYAWALHRSKSLSSAGNSLKKWWQSGWGWILSHKPGFATDLELNEEEKHFVGTHNKGSWRHVFYKIRAEFRRIIGSQNEGLPVTFRYDSKDYAKNFDDSVLRRSATLH